MKERYPQCFGLFERGEVECDGDPNGAADDDKAPCICRDRCAALQKVIKDTGRERRSVIAIKPVEVDGEEIQFAFPKGDPAKLDALLKRAIAKYGIKDGRVTLRPGTERKGKKPKAGTRASGKRLLSAGVPGEKAATESRTTGDEKAKEEPALLASWTTKRLEESCSRRVVESMAEAEEGEFVLVDRMGTSNYIAVYAKASGGKRLAICTGQPNSRTKRIQLRLAIGHGDYKKLVSETSWKRLSPEDYEGKDGAFRTRIMGLDKEGVSLVAESIAEAIRQGIIDLPEVG